MRLAFVLFSWFPHGGLQQDLLKIALACRDRAEVNVFCMHWDGPKPEALHIHELRCRGISRSARRKAFVSSIQQLRNEYDLVLGFNRMPGLDYYFAADSCFAWKAYRQRSWWYRLAPRTRQYLAWERAVFGAASETVALLLSPQQLEQYRSCYDTPAERLLMLPPGISRNFIPGAEAEQERTTLRRELGIGSDELLVLQVGSGFHTKGVDRSLQALAALPPELAARVHYRLLGRGDSGGLRKLADRLGLDPERAVFAGPCDQVPRYMQAADLLLHPSRGESAGLAILEAIVSGLPVLTTAACGYAFHVSQAGAGLVCPEPFEQQTLNTLLQQMLAGDLAALRGAALGYRKTRELFDMPGVVAEQLLAEAQA